MEKNAIIKKFSSYYDNVLNYMWAITLDDVLAEEITQQLYLKVFENPDYYSKFESIEAVLKKTAKNIYLDRFRREKCRLSAYDKLKAQFYTAAKERTLTEILEMKEVHNILIKSIKELPLELRQIITLHYAEGESLKDIASMLDIKYTTALTRKNTALKMLQKRLKRKDIQSSFDIRFFIVFGI